MSIKVGGESSASSDGIQISKKEVSKDPAGHRVKLKKQDKASRDLFEDAKPPLPTNKQSTDLLKDAQTPLKTQKGKLELGVKDEESKPVTKAKIGEQEHEIELVSYKQTDLENIMYAAGLTKTPKGRDFVDAIKSFFGDKKVWLGIAVALIVLASIVFKNEVFGESKE